ncbi:uncharacterized protein LOC110696959 [Chenopodium quinoa]|uniref:uncharacterized protein LOC110696959 n=1 Tax=Chenopodium quinoa TaxID=63459 RepID=UPI000B776592|nr:uncharacterized protein LOC110696959 [Chenopodium quinoa]
MEDCIQLLLENDDLMLYRVRIWRADKEITIMDPRVLIENDGSISDVDSMEYVPTEILFKIPTFEFTFSKGYFDKPGINIPVAFALAHFHGLKDGTPVEMYVTKWWKGVMRIKFDTNNKILNCTVKKGVQEMMAGEGVELGGRISVNLEGMEPPVLNITFT